jgi:hypothetical protein
VWILTFACRAAPPPPPRARTHADLHEARLREALSTPGTWAGSTGTIEVTPQRTLKLATRACQYPDLDPTRADPARPEGCQPQEGELELIGVEGPFVLIQQTEPRMPLYAPAWLDGAGALHLGPFASNPVWAAAVDDEGHAVYPFTPAHRLIVDPGRCTWEDQLGHRTVAIPCTATPDGAVTRLRFTVPPDGFGPWAGDHGAVTSAADGVMVDPEVEVVTFARRP